MSKEFKLAEDKYNNKAQFARLDTENSVEVTTDAVLNADYIQMVRIVPTSADAWVSIEAAATTPAVGTGSFIPFGSSITTKVPAGWHIGSTAEVNVTPWGS